jgi:peptidoglycan/xylan/chitin deacetylase (PgdA/CDA1 family)
LRKIILLVLIALSFPVTARAEIDHEVLLHHAKEAEVPIVMYHLVTEKSKYIGKFGITPSELRSDFEYLRENNYTTIVMQDLIDFINYRGDLPEKPIMLTFDDGNLSDYVHLFPLLREFDMKAVVAVIGEATDRFTTESEQNPKARYPNLTWNQILEMHESGIVEIQNHSYNLHKPPIGSGKKRGESQESYHARLLADTKRLQECCAENIGCMPSAFVYPLGVLGENSRAVFEELGMVGSISCQAGMNIIRQGDDDCLFRLLRTNRPSGRSIKQILDKL